MAPKRNQSTEINMTVVQRGRFEACVLGTTPIIPRRMSQKAMQELLLPHGRKSAAEKAASLKHDPLEEYRASAHIDKEDGPTAVQINAATFKMAMASIPLDVGDTGTSKAQLERLLYAEGDRIPVYGIPQLMMSVVRNSDMNHTPDIRTRLVIPRWAARLTITYVAPVLRAPIVETLLATAGFMRGVGDWRPEKGSGTYGCFEVVTPDDPRFLAIIKNGGRAAQMAALETPDFYDDETTEMYQWFVGERERKGHDTEIDVKAKGSNGKSKRGKSALDEVTA